jgi:ferrous iron transport protein B
MPVYTFLAAAFFPRYSGLIMVAMYFIGILIAIIVAFISKKTSFKDEAVPFVMELPNYRMPGFKNTMLLMWDKAKDFLQRAFTVIFVGTIIVWFLQSFDFGLHMVDDSSESILAAIAGLIAPIFKPLGLGDWRIVTALISGFMAKESIVSMISITYGTTEALVASLGGIQAFSFLIFCLLYTPCVAAVAAIRKEQGRAFAVKTVIFQCSVAWLAAFIARLIGQLIF